MKKNYLLTLLLLLAAAFNMSAAEVVDYGLLQLDTDYEFPYFKDVKGYYVADKDGHLTVSSTTSDFLTPYKDKELTERYDYTFNREGGGNFYDLKVTKGDTVFLFKNFCMAKGTFRLAMGSNVTLTATTDPAAGSVYTPSGTAQIIVTFNKAIKYGSAEIQAGETISPIEAYTTGNAVVFNAKNEVYQLMTEGKLVKDQEFILRLKDIKLSSDPTVIYGTDGTFEVRLVASAKPAAVESVVKPEEFLSYWRKGAAEAQFVMNFDAPLYVPTEADSNKIYAQITYGNFEGTGSEYYVEDIPLNIEGSSASIDLSGKLRRPADMLPSGNLYPSANIRVFGLRDTAGSYVYTSSNGTLGSFTFSLPYAEVKPNFTAEFTPASGGTLQNVSELEIWTTDFAQLEFAAVRFDFVNKAGEQKTLNVTDFSKHDDTEFEGAGYILVTLPAELKGAGKIKVSLDGLETADGIDHSALFMAEYDMNATGIGNIVVNAAETEVYTLGGIRLKAGEKRPAGVYILKGGRKIVK